MTKDYRTERGALLDKLEHQCIQPGLWEVEARQVYKTRWGWQVSNATTPDGRAISFDSFTTALAWIADHLQIAEAD